MSKSRGVPMGSEHGSQEPRGSITESTTSGRSGLSDHQVLASTSRMAVLELLRSRVQPMGVGEVARRIGLHQNTVRSHLDLLVDAGYALRRTEPLRGPGRPRIVYEATPSPEGGRNYQLLAEILAQHLLATSEHPGQEAAEGGRRWAGLPDQHQRGSQGEATSSSVSEELAIGTVVRMLGDIGFEPELSADSTFIKLHRCPFRELAETNPEVVCGAHLGLIQGALAVLGSPVIATRLLAFVQPELCIATLDRMATTPRNVASTASK
ncbi:MAG: helix-turn-helix domain-containing protein [Actinomycetota bacterium]